jgi:hypothetical protein
MRYAMLIYSDHFGEAAPAPNSPEAQAVLAGYYAFEREVREQGVKRAGEALQSVTTATTVRVRDGETLVTDGPFAETREQLGGFYLLECRDLDEAITYAAKIPHASIGSIEIRPIWEFPQQA